MTWILNRLALGDRHDLADADTLQRERVEAVLNTAAEVDDSPPIDGPYLHLFLEDGVHIPETAIEEGLDFLKTHVPERRVLVTCGAGISRSSAMAAVYLVDLGMELSEAVRRIQDRRPQASPHPALLESIEGYFQSREDPTG